MIIHLLEETTICDVDLNAWSLILILNVNEHRGRKRALVSKHGKFTRINTFPAKVSTSMHTLS